jgi:hypothetical protein
MSNLAYLNVRNMKTRAKKIVYEKAPSFVLPYFSYPSDILTSVSD